MNSSMDRSPTATLKKSIFFKVAYAPLFATLLIAANMTSAHQLHSYDKKPCHRAHAKTCGGKLVEDLDRGLVVIPTESGNAVSWRLLNKDSATAKKSIKNRLKMPPSISIPMAKRPTSIR